MGCLCRDHFSRHHRPNAPCLMVGRPSSALKDYVLFLITMVMESGSVERFLSFAKYTDTDQIQTSDMVWMTMATGKLS